MQQHYATQSATLGVQADDVRVEDLRGREHVVAPVTLVREMVLKGEFLPFEEIEATQLAWNAKPSTITHPTNQDGDFVPASVPDQFESHVVAKLFGVEGRSAARSLDGEVWIDRERSAAIAESLDRDDPAELLLDDETVEVSVGYWYERFDTEGEFEGDEFDAVQVNIQPDHLALLPNAEGECSVEDGCGAGRDDASGVTMSALRASASKLYAGAERLGFGGSSGNGDHTFGAACPDCGGNCDAHNDSEESTANDGSGHETPTSDMDDKRIQNLAEQSEFDTETLRGMDDEQIEALEQTLEEPSNNDGGDDPPADDLADQIAGQVEEQVLDSVDDRLSEFERQQKEDERQELIGQICAQTGDEPEDYEDWSMGQLEKFADNIGATGGVYVGQGGTRGNSADLDDVDVGGAFTNMDAAEEGGD